jgi:hypothetical protein
VLRPADIAALHRHQRDWLAAWLAACGGRATVVTHHVPHPALLARPRQSRGHLHPIVRG